ncbi:MAG: hypothetical protein VST67_08595, partial [Nitrospirota bacterium]|nr:hypothetical protein [Nitrospirota bacterium]
NTSNNTVIIVRIYFMRSCVLSSSERERAYPTSMGLMAHVTECGIRLSFQGIHILTRKHHQLNIHKSVDKGNVCIARN